MNESADGPVCVAVVLCDTIIDDVRTRNKSLIGIFNAVVASQVPCTHPRMSVLVSLTNVLGRVPIRVVIRDPQGGDLITLNGAPLESDDPLLVYDLVFEFLGLPLPLGGVYGVDVFSGSHYLGSRRFTVLHQPNSA